MSYQKWLLLHAKKHEKIVDKLRLKGYSKKQIVAYFDYTNFSKNEPEFCPLFEKGQKCHDMDDLNCYFCGCPNFRFYQNQTKKVRSFCKVASKDGGQFSYKNSIHQDCSNCTIPHKQEYVLQNYTHNWIDIMQLCKIET